MAAKQSFFNICSFLKVRLSATPVKSQQLAGLATPKQRTKDSEAFSIPEIPLRADGVNDVVHVIAATCSLPVLVDVP